jgi:hypothetical protein
MKNFILICLLISGSCLLHAQPGGGGQNNTCEFADPFCTGTQYNFPAGVNAGNGQPGPCYQCLATRPNPAWYYMKVENPGNIIIFMHSEPSRDIDFCCWGPFPSENVCTELTCNKVVDCSYSPNPTETCDILNAQTGQYYILVITNFSNLPCNIIFEQTGGTGTTDCSILPPPCNNNSPICAGQTLQLTAQAVSGATYHWWGPDNFTANVQNPIISNATVENAGEYFLTITVGGQPSADTSTTMAYIYQPDANAGNDTAINNGIYTTLHGSCTGGSGSYNYHWEPADKLVDPDIAAPQTVNLFSTTLFTLTVTDDSANCQSTDMVTISISGGALAVNAVATPASICAGTSTQLQAFGSGGAGNYSYSWTGPNGFTSTLQNPTVIPAATSTYSVSIFDGYNTSSGDVTVTVIPLPVAHAGDNKSIPYGTYTFLSGSVTVGSGNYFYSWSPASQLLNANIQSPQTTNLTATTVYSLIVTDLFTNCVSNNQATIAVEVTGGALNVNPVATPNWICRGDTSQLHASAGGGNVGFYAYTWSSNPGGFTSDQPDPVITPQINTTYHVSVFDGFNTTTGNTTVSIFPEPVIHLGPADTTVCIYDTVRIDAGNAGSGFLWSNGATSQVIRVGTTGIGYDAQTYSVEVTNSNGCKSSSSITIIYSFDACTGIGEQNLDGRIRIYPNPAGEKVTITMEGLTGMTRGELISAYGKPLRSFLMPAGQGGDVAMSLDLSGLPGGVYLLRFSNPNFIHTEKLVIE